MAKRATLQNPRLRTTSAEAIISNYVGMQFHEHIAEELKGRDDLKINPPSLDWCKLAARFAIFGDREGLHNVFPDWLKNSFVDQKDVLIEALQWCRDYWADVLFTKTGKPKIKGHMLLAAFNYGHQLQMRYFREIALASTEGRTLPGEQIEALTRIDTRELHKYAQENGFIPKTKYGAGDNHYNFDALEFILKDVVRDYDNWYSQLPFEKL